MAIHRYRFWPGDNHLISDGPKLAMIRRHPMCLLQVPWFGVGQLIALLRLCRHTKVDTIHAHWILPQGLVALLYKKVFNHRIRVVVTAHGADIFGLRPLGWLKRRVVRGADAVTAVSHAIEQEIHRLLPSPRTPVFIIPMGTDTERFKPDTRRSEIRARYGANGPLLLFVGRLTEKKGVRYLMDAMPRVVKAHPTAKLLIAGYGDERESLEKQARRLGLMNRGVFFIGRVTHDELPALYASADIFVGPSIVGKDGDTEGFGLVFAEALASGCLVVASDLPGIADIIREGETGCIVPQKDSEALGRRLVELMDHLDHYQAMRRHGRRFVQTTVAWPVIEKKYANLLRR